MIELDSPSMTVEQVAAIEQSVNEKIRARLPVNVRELSLDDPEVEQVRESQSGSVQGMVLREPLLSSQMALLPLSPSR